MSPAFSPPLRHLRWRVAAILFLSTTINYIDRQSFSVLAPILRTEYRWSNSDVALIIIAFRIAYASGQLFSGRWLDRIGTRIGLAAAVGWYSVASLLTPLAQGLNSLAFFRFLLGLGESANWPGATKTVSEWFPRSERSLAVAIFDSGSAIGGAVAPFIVLGLYHSTGSWRYAVAIPGVLGLLWLLLWWSFYQPPDRHPRLGESERALILADREKDRLVLHRTGYWDLLKRRETWGIVLGRMLTDPVWFFVTDWFAVFLVSRKIKLEEGVLAFWIPFIAADAGNFLGGAISGWLVSQGWHVVRARKAVILICGIGMSALVFAITTTNVFALATLFGVSTLCYAAWSTMALTFPSDLFPQQAVASVSGLSGAAAGVGTILTTFLIGWTLDRYDFAPVLATASFIPLIATLLVFLLIRPNPESQT